MTLFEVHSGIYVKGLRKIMKTTARIAELRDET
jgi:hypothetical protein